MKRTRLLFYLHLVLHWVDNKQASYHYVFPTQEPKIQTNHHHCAPLTTSKNTRAALEKGKITQKKRLLFRWKKHGLSECDEPIKPAKFTNKQYQAASAKLRQTGMTDD